MEKDDKLKALDAALGQIEKQFGKGAVIACALKAQGMKAPVRQAVSENMAPDAKCSTG